MEPLVSIITINRNNADGLRKTLASIFAQSFSKFESLVIDGASIDGSRKIIKEYASKIQYSVSEPDSGIYNAMNKGIKVAKGKYCLFLNSGDLLPTVHTLASIVKFNPSAEIVYGDILIDDGKQQILGKMPEHLTVDLFVERELWHQAFIKRGLFSTYGQYDEGFRYAADYAFYLKVIVRRKVTTQYIPIPFAIFNTFGEGSSSGNRLLVQREREVAKRKYLTWWQLWWTFRIRYWVVHKLLKPIVRKLFGEAIFSRLKHLLGRHTT